jgi:hypothetical protein
MGSGNKDIGQTTLNTASTPPAPSVSTGMQYPAFMPGQQQAIANQLSAGYGALPADNMGLLSMYHRPVSLPMIQNSTDMSALAKMFPDMQNVAAGGVARGGKMNGSKAASGGRGGAVHDQAGVRATGYYNGVMPARKGG